MVSKIGIKLADGAFFPILDEDALSEESLELTTVRDNQESVQINLFKRFEDNTPEYIGSLIVEEISGGSAGDPTINLKIKLDEEKNLSAEAVDEGSGSHQSLKVSLKNFDEASLDGIDFDFASIDEPLNFDDDLNIDSHFTESNDNPYFDDNYENQTLTGASLYDSDEEKSEKKKKMPRWLIILIIILCVTALVFAILLLTKKMPLADTDKMASAPTQVEKEEPQSKKDVNATTSTIPREDPAAKAAQEAKLKEKQKAEEETAKLKAKQKAEEEAKKKAVYDAKKKTEVQKKTAVNANGVARYKIKWGDTLWYLSETFYKTPWLYKKIADYNKIKNPNLIIAGTYIDIPPK